METKKDVFFPELSKNGKDEAIKLIDDFKSKLKAVADDVIGDLYCEILPYIESDSWSNFRNQIMSGFRDYGNSKIMAKYDFKEIRKSILEHHREELINDLNQDLLEEIRSLKDRIISLNEILRLR